MGLLASDVANVRHLVRMPLAGDALNLLSGICDKQFPTRRSDVTAAILLEDAKFLGVIAEPDQISVGL